MAIVGAAINLGKKFGMSVIAEGIEDADTAELLWRSGCETGQGYYFGPRCRPRNSSSAFWSKAPEGCQGCDRRLAGLSFRRADDRQRKIAAMGCRRAVFSVIQLFD